MITFRVVKEQHGWAVRMGESMTTPFRLRGVAIREASGMAAGIRSHGVVAEVLVEETDTSARVGLKRDSGSPGRLTAVQ